MIGDEECDRELTRLREENERLRERGDSGGRGCMSATYRYGCALGSIGGYAIRSKHSGGGFDDVRPEGPELDTFH